MKVVYTKIKTPPTELQETGLYNIFGYDIQKAAYLYSDDKFALFYWTVVPCEPQRDRAAG